MIQILKLLILRARLLATPGSKRAGGQRAGSWWTAGGQRAGGRLDIKVTNSAQDIPRKPRRASCCSWSVTFSAWRIAAAVTRATVHSSCSGAGLLAPSWLHLGPSWLHLGPSWLHLDPSWLHPGPSWLHLGSSLAPSWLILAPSWLHLGPS